MRSGVTDDMGKKAWKAVIWTVYGLGCAALAVLLAAALFGGAYVPFPDAMLPMTLAELASGWMAAGFFPLLAVSFLAWRQIEEKGGRRPRLAWALFLPAAVCLGFLLSRVGVWAAGLWQFS